MEIASAVSMLENELSFNAADAHIQNLEIGVNIELSIPPTIFLQENLILYKWTEPIVRDFNNSGHYREFEMTQYYFKIYDKGRQYGVDRRILRLELKSKKSQFFARTNNHLMLSDLTNADVLTALGEKLSIKAEELMICDPVTKSKVSNKDDRMKLLEYKNPKYWMGLKGRVSNKVLWRKRKDFESLKEKYQLNRLQQEVQTKLKAIVQKLLKMEGVLS